MKTSSTQTGHAVAIWPLERESTRSRAQRLAFAALLLVAFVELVRTAWISDDAAITLRTVLNFINGYGARFNIAERVQVYTHPLWFLAVSALSFATNDVFWSMYVLSIGVSIAVLWILIAGVATRFQEGLLAVAVLTLSKAYVDYSTSGLENPLSHFLVLGAIVLGRGAIRHATFGATCLFFLVSASTYLSRPDLPLLLAPLAFLVVYEVHKRGHVSMARAIVIGALPVLAWTAFSLYYYGFPFPNPAYAKLGSGISRSDLVTQGLRYVQDSATGDPLTLAAIVAGVAIGFASSTDKKMLATGITLYLGYVVSIGGDFMAGRFFTAPLVAAVAIIAMTPLPRRGFQVLTVGFLCLGTINITSTVLSGKDYKYKGNHYGIADERGFYMRRSLRNFMAADSSFRKEASLTKQWNPTVTGIAVACQIGFRSIFQGPAKHWIDGCAIADPLLARLPAKAVEEWRIGHFHRQYPTDYIPSVEHGGNMIVDPTTRAYYESIRRITRGRLNSASRFREVLLMNLGMVQKPDWSLYRYSDVPRLSGQ